MSGRRSPSILTSLWLFEACPRTPSSHLRLLAFCVAKPGLERHLTHMGFADPISTIMSGGYRSVSSTAQHLVVLKETPSRNTSSKAFVSKDLGADSRPPRGGVD